MRHKLNGAFGFGAKWLIVAMVVAGLAASASAGATEDLFKAVQSGNAAKVQALLKAGANPKAVNKWGYTPLHLAA
ncbi:MAG: ankyrin repeat domain-containing protein, partial [Proteobacteria bacterium]|nr:ankyrin repeat domain-containing protein [Pseudomonadota bacterium]